MRTLRNLLTLIFLASVLVLASCGDDEGNGTTGQPDVGADAAADQGAPDQGVPDQAVPDQGTPDIGNVCANPNTECRTPLPSSSGVPRVMIEQIHIAQDYVVLKNVNTVDANLNGWWVCQRPNYQQLPDGITLGPAATVRINLGQSGTNTASEVFLPDASPLTREDEIAFFSSNDFESAAAIEVYLRWGSPANGTGRSNQAAQAGLWSQGDFVPVCGDNVGIIAVGDGFIPRGFRDVPASCF